LEGLGARGVKGVVDGCLTAPTTLPVLGSIKTFKALLLDGEGVLPAKLLATFVTLFALLIEAIEWHIQKKECYLVLVTDVSIGPLKVNPP